MTEATWGESAKTPDINWRMSASLENVPRGEAKVAAGLTTPIALQRSGMR